MRAFSDGPSDSPYPDNLAPPAARGLMIIARLDNEIEAARFQQMALVHRLERVKRETRAAHDDIRTQEMHVMFVESSPHYTTSQETLRQMRDWLETARHACLRCAAEAVSEARDTQTAFDRWDRHIELLSKRRRAVAVAPEVLRLYEASTSSRSSPRIVAFENGACGACGSALAGPPPISGIRLCPGCRRVVYWRRPS
jgi:predicted  nucleic acid-binding Zn-ribbon protein